VSLNLLQTLEDIGSGISKGTLLIRAITFLHLFDVRENCRNSGVQPKWCCFTSIQGTLQRTGVMLLGPSLPKFNFND
jgi:hypothetical protein